MASKRKRYLMIGLFFTIISLFSIVAAIKGNVDKSFFTYAGISGLVAILFLKNAFSRQ